MNTAEAAPGLDQIKTELLGIGPVLLKCLQEREAMRQADNEQHAVQAAFAATAPVIKQLFAAGADFNEVLAALVSAVPSAKPETLRAALAKHRDRPPRSTRGAGRGRRARTAASAADDTSTAPAQIADAATPAPPGGETSAPSQSDASAARRRRSKFIGED